MKKIIYGICLCMYLCIFTACTSNEGMNEIDNKNGTNIPSTEKKSTFKLNEDIIINNDYGEYRIKFKSVKETNDRNEYSDIKADRVVIISYEYENISLEDDLYVSGDNFKAYDKDNNSLETYEVIDYKYPDSISKGRKKDAEMVFALNNDNNYIELEHYDNMFDSKATNKIIVEW